MIDKQCIHRASCKTSFLLCNNHPTKRGFVDVVDLCFCLCLSTKYRLIINKQSYRFSNFIGVHVMIYILTNHSMVMTDHHHRSSIIICSSFFSS